MRNRYSSWEGKEEEEVLLRLLVWVVLCEQWPVHIAWSLLVLEDLQQRRHLHRVGGGDEDLRKDLVNPSDDTLASFPSTTSTICT